MQWGPVALGLPTVVAFVLILLKTNTKGTSSELRRVLKYRHGIYFTAYLFFTLFLIIDGGF